MALVNTLKADNVHKQLQLWLAQRFPDAVVSNVEICATSGLSCETVMFSAAWSDGAVRRDEALVARVQPPGEGLFISYNMPLEFRVLKGFRDHSQVRVPEPLFLETDSNVLGAPFIVMTRLPGRTPPDDPPYTAGGWVLDLEPDQQARLIDNALQTLVAIHAADPDLLGLGEVLDHPLLGSDVFEQQIAHWEKAFRWAGDDASHELIEAGFAWLKHNKPSPPQRKCICWGDARIANLVFNDDLTVSGALDWEMVMLGIPEFDLGWWLFMQRYHSDAIGLALPPGFPLQDELLARYEALSGHAIENLHYCMVLTGVRLSICMLRATTLMIRGGLLPPDTAMAINNPATKITAALLGLPTPGGETQSYIGNR